MLQQFVINPRRILIALVILTCVLATLSIIGEYLLETAVDSDEQPVLALGLDLFSVNSEETIPTWYSTVILLIAAALLALIASAKRASADPLKYYWAGLALVFLYLSLDEGAAIHEIVSDSVQANLNTTGFLYFGWHVVALPVLAVFGLVYVRFLLRLTPRTRNLLILAGLIYVGGAFFVEGLSANQYYLDDEASLRYLAIGTVEEFLEMLGVVVLIYALLDHMAAMQYGVALLPQANAAPDSSAEAAGKQPIPQTTPDRPDLG